MLESHLVEGRQDYTPGQQATFGQSITDACISFEQTEPILEQLGRRRAAGARDEEVTSCLKRRAPTRA